MKIAFALLVCCGLHVMAQDAGPSPAYQQHARCVQHSLAQHQARVEERGDEGMGFPHDKTTHHFRLYKNGGAIEVTADDSKDSANIQSIRSHLVHIVSMFSKGDFALPMFIHEQVPPGVDTMKEKRSEISYSFEEMAAGGRVRIKTANPDALKAIHQFLRFQIEDHHTGDSTEIGASRSFWQRE